MQITIERLRTWIVLLGVLLLVAILGFFAYARYRMHQYAHDLPQKLGFEIQQSTNDFTYSQSHQGRTLFVLHAAKAVQYKGGGRAILHDVTIVMYSKTGTQTDRISGSQFEYDPTARMVRADGAVDIELTDPGALAGSLQASSPAEQGKASVRPLPSKAPIHVKTSGLIFDEKTQIATTEQSLTFQQGTASGSAHGATYDSARGTLALASDVILNTDIDGDPVSVKAQSANFDRNARQLYLIRQVTDYRNNHSTSDQATVFFRGDGKADHVHAEGNLHLTTEDGGNLQAANGSAQLSAEGGLKDIQLDGGVLLTNHDALHSLHVNSTSGVISFLPAVAGHAGPGTAARPTHVRLLGAVSIVDQQLSLPGDAHGSETRESRAQQMDIALHADAQGHTQPQSVLAVGGATFVTHTIHADAPQQITRLKGEQIYADLLEGHNLSALRASGDTSIEQETPGGLSQTSSADSLSVHFLPGYSPAGGRQAHGAVHAASTTNDARTATAKRGSPADGVARQGSNQGSNIDAAVLDGHATLVEQQPSPIAGAPPAVTTSTADRITYDGRSGMIHLDGGTPRIQEEGADLTAASIVFSRATGAAAASGGIKATYGGKDPVRPEAPGVASKSAAISEATHVLADHATLDHAKDETTFFGSAHGDARLWQGPSSIMAPTIVLSRARQLLTATGPTGSVKATFPENGKSSKKGSASSTSTAAALPSSVVQTSSASLVYSGGERKVTLTGGVVARTTDSMLRAATLELYLDPVDRSTGARQTKSNMGPGGQVERLVARTNVRFGQGNRTGAGDMLVYTADDGRFLLTGSGAAQPHIVDPASGTVTGSSLIFNNRDDSVVVSHGQSPTMTDTHTRSDARTNRSPGSAK